MNHLEEKQELLQNQKRIAIAMLITCIVLCICMVACVFVLLYQRQRLADMGREINRMERSLDKEELELTMPVDLTEEGTEE